MFNPLPDCLEGPEWGPFFFLSRINKLAQKEILET
jgi:hypothetical protein